MHEKIAPLGDQTLLWPAHGSGSVCGGNIAERDESTLGLERACNPVFTKSRDEFIEAKLRERIPRPPYFALMERLNLEGGMPPGEEPERRCELPTPRSSRRRCKQGIVLDGREPEAFAGGHIPGSFNVWLDGMAIFGGWLANQTTPIYLVLDSMNDLETAVLSLARLGVDGIQGVLAGGFAAWRDAGQPLDYSGTMRPRARGCARDSRRRARCPRRHGVRGRRTHRRGARHLYVGYLDEHLGRIKHELIARRTIAVVCSVGHRAGLAASILRRHGFENVKNLLGGMTAWTKLELPTSKDREHT